MITNLFNSFDPSTNFLSLNWIRSTLILLIIPSTYWLIPSRLRILWIQILTILHKEFKVLIINKIFNGRTIIFIRLFIFIIINNLIGLFPYIFTSSRHLNFTLTLRLPIWLRFILYGWWKNTIHIFAHLVPQGAPSVLLPFLVLVESIRNIIRPGTLAIRLTANIIAGHLLVTLMGNAGNNLRLILLQILILRQILLLILETAVSIIQAYVFSILMTLYSREIK